MWDRTRQERTWLGTGRVGMQGMKNEVKGRVVMHRFAVVTVAWMAG